jgi:hypothetical protein
LAIDPNLCVRVLDPPSGPQRRRYLSGAEMADMLGRQLHEAVPDLGRLARYGAARLVIDELGALGVDVSGLVKAEVDEADVVTYPDRRTLGQRIADAQPRITLSGPRR